MIDDQQKTKQQLIKELQACRNELADLNETQANHAESAHYIQKLNSIFKAAPIGVGVVRNRILTDVNNQVCRITGYAKEELLGQSSFLLYPTQEAYERSGRDKYAQIAQTGIGTVETQWKRKNGEIIDILLSSSLFDPKDLSKGVTFTAIDITERKQIEKALRNSEENYRLLSESAHAIIVVFDLSGIITYINRYGIDFLGFDESDIVGSPVDRFLDESGKARQRKLTEAFQKGRSRKSVTELIIHNARGAACYLELHIMPIIKEDEPISVLTIGQDISERKNTEALLSARLRLSELSTGLNMEELLQRFLDEAEKLTESNIAFFHFINEDEQTVELQTWSTNTLTKMCKAEGAGRHYPLTRAGVWVDCVKSRKPVIHNNYEELPHKKGLPEGHAPIKRELIVPVIRDQKIRIICGVGNKAVDYSESDIHIVSALTDMAWDIVERKRAEEAKETVIRELEVKNAELEQFTYTVSHDLKSPLITVQGFVGALESQIETCDVETSRKYMGFIRDAVSQMENLLKDILELSRIGRVINPPVDVSLEKLAHDALRDVNGLLKDKSIQIYIETPLPTIYCDQVRIREVLVNLLENAIKFMGEQKEPVIAIGCEIQEGKHCIYVQDNGIGIDPKYHEKVFQLFDKLDHDTQGTGVGLALVKRIVEVHGGSIHVESKGLRQGTRIVLCLPHCHE